MKDYELEEIEEAGGKVRRRYVYRGDRYERQVTPTQRRRERYAGVLAALLAGFVLGFAMLVPMRFFHKRGNRLGLIVGFLFTAIGLADLLGLSSLMLCMGFGATVANLRGEYRERRLLLTAMPLLGTVLHTLGIHVIAAGTDQGTIQVVDKARGMPRTIKALLGQMEARKDCQGAEVVISHCHNLEGANALREAILGKLPVKSVHILACRGLTTYYAMDKGLIVVY